VRDAPRPRVLALEWLDPPFAGGHWVPQMIELAGGEDALGLPGERSHTFDWAEAAAAQPDLAVSMPCGYGAERAASETELHLEEIARTGVTRVVAVDASSYFSRPGPRLVDGVELLAWLLHPQLVEAPPPGRAIELAPQHATR
jgi:iron complex transport system substrate-binding protein